jgi:hypothetical protein
MIEKKLERFSKYTFTPSQARPSAAVMYHTSLAAARSESQSRIDDEQEVEEAIVT